MRVCLIVCLCVHVHGLSFGCQFSGLFAWLSGCFYVSFVRLFVCLCVRLFACLCVCLFVCLLVCVIVRLFGCLLDGVRLFVRSCACCLFGCLVV